MNLLINICKEKLHYYEFVKPIEDILKNNKTKFFTRHYKEISDKDLEKAGKVIICGTSLKDDEFLKDIKKFFWLKEFKKSILGICGGAHIIGLILGGKLKKKKEIGFKEINIEKEFLGIDGKMQVYFLHKFYVLPEIYQKENFYATLFHPEVRNKEIIERFAGL
jgi:GMP synthase (glutamine-hydrolysing)